MSEKGKNVSGDKRDEVRNAPIADRTRLMTKKRRNEVGTAQKTSCWAGTQGVKISAKGCSWQ